MSLCSQCTYQNETIQVNEVEPRFNDRTNETAWRENVDKVLKEWFKDQDLVYVTLYFGDPDSTGHKYGLDSPERREAVKKGCSKKGCLTRFMKPWKEEESSSMGWGFSKHLMDTINIHGKHYAICDQFICSKCSSSSTYSRPTRGNMAMTIRTWTWSLSSGQ